MQRPKSILLFLIFISIMVITFIVAGRFSLPEDKRKIKDPLEEEFIDIKDSLDVNSVSKKNYNGFVAEPSIPLDDDIKVHLENFRNKASMLAKNFPHTFITCISTSERLVALTFDDGPDNFTTPQIVDILNKHHVPATFFLIGESIDKYPNICEKIIASGHQIANHSFSHARPTDISIDEMLNEFDKCHMLVDKISSQSKKYVRPPYGLVTEKQLASLENKGFNVIGWSIDSMDWYTDDKSEIIECVVDAIHPGAIVLMHSTGGSDNRQATLNALPIIIETLKEQGYSFVTIEQLLGR